MTLTERYIYLVEQVNESKTQAQHDMNYQYLEAWKDGVDAASSRVPICAGDHRYLSEGCERPMVGGVWLDWKPSS